MDIKVPGLTWTAPDLIKQGNDAAIGTGLRLKNRNDIYETNLTRATDKAFDASIDRKTGKPNSRAFFDYMKVNYPDLPVTSRHFLQAAEIRQKQQALGLNQVMTDKRLSSMGADKYVKEKVGVVQPPNTTVQVPTTTQTPTATTSAATGPSTNARELREKEEDAGLDVDRNSFETSPMFRKEPEFDAGREPGSGMVQSKDNKSTLAANDAEIERANRFNDKTTRDRVLRDKIHSIDIMAVIEKEQGKNAVIIESDRKARMKALYDEYNAENGKKPAEQPKEEVPVGTLMDIGEGLILGKVPTKQEPKPVVVPTPIQINPQEDGWWIDTVTSGQTQQPEQGKNVNVNAIARAAASQIHLPESATPKQLEDTREMLANFGFPINANSSVQDINNSLDIMFEQLGINELGPYPVMPDFTMLATKSDGSYDYQEEEKARLAYRKEVAAWENKADGLTGALREKYGDKVAKAFSGLVAQSIENRARQDRSVEYGARVSTANNLDNAFRSTIEDLFDKQELNRSKGEKWRGFDPSKLTKENIKDISERISSYRSFVKMARNVDNGGTISDSIAMINTYRQIDKIDMNSGIWNLLINETVKGTDKLKAFLISNPKVDITGLATWAAAQGLDLTKMFSNEKGIGKTLVSSAGDALAGHLKALEKSTDSPNMSTPGQLKNNTLPTKEMEKLEAEKKDKEAKEREKLEAEEREKLEAEERDKADRKLPNGNPVPSSWISIEGGYVMPKGKSKSGRPIGYLMNNEGMDTHKQVIQMSDGKWMIWGGDKKDGKTRERHGSGGVGKKDKETAAERLGRLKRGKK